jgi:FAD/FMN-containing dehydrogenase
MITSKELVSGWSNFNKKESIVFKPKNLYELNLLNIKKIIPRGSGLSYGDSSISPKICSSIFLKKIIMFDKKKGIIECESGVTFNELLKIINVHGWFFYVTPGSSYVSIGGAIASDVHGKNHYLSGSFCNHLVSIKLLCANKKIITLSKNKNKKLFYATCGGMGLTGVIISAKFKLKKIHNNLISVNIFKYDNISSLINKFNSTNNIEYRVAWIDLSHQTKINSILFLGNHDTSYREKSIQEKNFKQINISFISNFFEINNFLVKIFNKCYFFLHKEGKIKLNLYNFFYPLDKIKNWNKFYGDDGFIQYQFVLPEINFEHNLSRILYIIKKFKNFPILSVLKKFGKKNKNYLSFPQKGFSLALDFKYSKNLKKMISEIDKIILELNGRIYLSKDSLMSAKTFKKTYPLQNQFRKILSLNNFQYESLQSKRLKIT